MHYVRAVVLVVLVGVVGVVALFGTLVLPPWLADRGWPAWQRVTASLALAAAIGLIFRRLHAWYEASPPPADHDRGNPSTSTCPAVDDARLEETESRQRRRHDSCNPHEP